MTDAPVPGPPGWDPAVRPPHPGPYPGFPPPPPAVFPVYPPPDDPLISVDYNGWWSRSLRLLKAVWLPATLLQLLWVVPSAVLAAVFAFQLTERIDQLAATPDNAEPDWHPFVRLLAVGLPLGLAAMLLVLLATLGTLHLVVQAAAGRPLSVPAALRAAVRRIPAYVGWGVVGGLLTLAGLVCCVLPGYYVTVVLTILPAVVLLERGSAVARCFRMFHARVGDALARLATMLGVAMVASFVAQLLLVILSAPFGLFRADGVPEPALFVIGVAGLMLSALVQVVLAPMHVTTYADMRARYEPFSTAQLAADVMPQA